MNRRGFLRLVPVAGAGVLAGCVGGGDTDPDGAGATTDDYDGFLDNARNVTGTVDLTGQERVTIEVGVGEQGYGFGPAAARISVGTTVVWEWVGQGGSHNVMSVADAPVDFVSPYASDEGATFERTLETTGVIKYYCAPHRSLGMRGVLVVE